MGSAASRPEDEDDDRANDHGVGAHNDTLTRAARLPRLRVEAAAPPASGWCVPSRHAQPQPTSAATPEPPESARSSSDDDETAGGSSAPSSARSSASAPAARATAALPRRAALVLAPEEAQQHGISPPVLTDGLRFYDGRTAALIGGTQALATWHKLHELAAESVQLRAAAAALSQAQAQAQSACANSFRPPSAALGALMREQTALNARLQQQWRSGHWAGGGSSTIMSATVGLHNMVHAADVQARRRREAARNGGGGGGGDGLGDSSGDELDDRGSPLSEKQHQLQPYAAALGTTPAWMVQRALDFNSSSSPAGGWAPASLQQQQQQQRMLMQGSGVRVGAAAHVARGGAHGFRPAAVLAGRGMSRAGTVRAPHLPPLVGPAGDTAGPSVMVGPGMLRAPSLSSSSSLRPLQQQQQQQQQPAALENAERSDDDEQDYDDGDYADGDGDDGDSAKKTDSSNDGEQFFAGDNLTR